MWRFILVFYFLMGTFVYLKNFIIPALLNVFLPVSDFQSTLFEVVILVFGVLTGFLYFSFGSFARHYYGLSHSSFLLTLLLIFLPLTVPLWIESNSGWWQLHFLWLDLMAEPYRLLLFTYHLSHAFGIVLPILLTGFGYMVQVTEQKLHRTNQHSKSIRGI